MFRMKFLAAALGVLMLLPTFVACSGGNGGDETSETEAAVSETEKSEDRTQMDFYLTYPDYNTKAFTVSYDDGTIQDKKVMMLARRYGVGVTFAPNTAWWGSSGWMEHEGYTVWVQRPTLEEIPTFYDGFEIASHTATHIDMTKADDETIRREVFEDMKYMYQLTGQKTIGMCYPGNWYDDRSIAIIKSYGIIYGRSAAVNYGFDLPEDFMVWIPTSHDAHPDVPKLADQFLAKKTHRLLCFYIWGHAYELDKPSLIEGTTRWENLENLFKKMGTSGTVWCATNGQIATYVLATRECEETDEYFHNKSNETIYALHGDYKIVIEPGQKYMMKDGSIVNG